MKIVRPTWRLKILCPCCGQCHPLLIGCPHCEYVAAWCDEVGNSFLDPHDLAASMTTDEAAKCPACGVCSLKDFVKASSEQICNAGLLGEYD